MNTHTARKIIIGLTSAAAIGSASTAPPALAAGDYGPSTCLEGFVWRGAFTGDRVCVTREGQAQAARDNAAAASRRVGGAYGPDTCAQGFIWRLARESDRVCVTRATYNATQADNAAAASRRNALTTRTSTYNSGRVVCDGQTCTTSGSSPRIKVIVDRINVGRAIVRLYRSNGQHVRSWYADSKAVPGRPGGRVEFNSPQPACSGPANAYIRVQDPVSRRKSLSRWVTIGCSAL